MAIDVDIHKSNAKATGIHIETKESRQRRLTTTTFSNKCYSHIHITMWQKYTFCKNVAFCIDTATCSQFVVKLVHES